MSAEDSQAAGRSVIVTGAGSGIGAATVAELARRGASVLAVDIDGDRLERSLGELGGRVRAHPADVSDEAAVAGAVAAAVEAFGRLDALFNNAGVLGDLAPLDQLDSADAQAVLAVNVLGVIYGMKHGIPALRAAGGGRIVNTASTGGLTGAAGLAPYIASKHAVIGLTRVAAIELATDGIAVNALCPGMVDTEMLAQVRAGVPEGAEEPGGAGPPIGRAAAPEEIAETAAWLLLGSPQYLTGTAIPVDGAFTAQ